MCYPFLPQLSSHLGALCDTSRCIVSRQSADWCHYGERGGHLSNGCHLHGHMHHIERLWFYGASRDANVIVHTPIAVKEGASICRVCQHKVHAPSVAGNLYRNCLSGICILFSGCISISACRSCCCGLHFYCQAQHFAFASCIDAQEGAKALR